MKGKPCLPLCVGAGYQSSTLDSPIVDKELAYLVKQAPRSWPGRHGRCWNRPQREMIAPLPINGTEILRW
jgi:hypothetical protein